MLQLLSLISFEYIILQFSSSVFPFFFVISANSNAGTSIKYSKGLVTNSYHGMIMAILNHVPFVVILESGEVSGMNDRFYTLLDRLELKDRIHQYFSNRLIDLLEDSIDWSTVESEISDYRRIGVDFLNNALTV